MFNNIFEKSLFVFDVLQNNGFECYAVGGCVRDMLLGIIPNDIDFTTNANPDEILQCFKDYKTFELGKKFGTISVVKDDMIYEITTYRIDGSYEDGRHPDSVTFSRNLQDDLSRRDFTINAMAMDKNGNVVDLFGGKQDLENKLIRAVGKPQKRFSEDALRIFRALRFSAKLGFSIEPETAASCHELSGLLSKVHPQRMQDELSRLLMTKNPENVLYEYRDVIGVIIPEFKPAFDFRQNTPHHRYDVFTHIIKSLRFAPEDLLIRVSLFFHDIAKPLCHTQDISGLSHFKGHPIKSAEISLEILRRFGYPKEFVNRVFNLIKFHDRRFEKPKVHIKKILAETGAEDFKRLMIIQRCDALAQSEYKREEKLMLISSIEALFREIVSEAPCLKVTDLKLNGEDIMALGAKGKEIGDTLDYLLAEVISENIPNDKDALLKCAKAYIDTH